MCKEKELSEFLEDDIKKIKTKKATKAFGENGVWGKDLMSIEAAKMQLRDLLNNFENYNEIDIEEKDISAIRTILTDYDSKETKKPLKPIKVKINMNREKIEDVLKKLIDVGLIEKKDYRNLEIEIE